MSYIFLKTAFPHLKHYLQIYLTLLSVDLQFGKWHEEYEKFSPLKIGILMGSFNLNLKKYELKIHRGVICHDYEEWRKIWRGIDLWFQSWHEEFHEFWPEHLKVSQIFILMYSFWAKYILSEKVTEQLYFMKLNRDTKFERNRLVVSKLA